MHIENEEHRKKGSPVVSYKKDKAKGHRLEDTAETD